MKRWLTIAAFLVTASLAGAQNFQNYSFGENSLSDFNPASIMEDGSLVYGCAAYNWYDSDLYKEKPYNFAIGGNAIQKWGGISARLDYDEYSFFKRHNLQLNYSYQWKLGKDGDKRLSIGGGLSLGFENINLGAMKYDEGQCFGCTPDFNIGIEFSNGRLRAGLGGVNLLATPLKVDGAAVTRNPRVLLTYLMYRFDIKDVVGITPMAYVGYCEKTLVEIGVRADFKKIIYLSYGFRAMDLRHIVTMNFNIPRTPVTFNLSYAGAEFYYAQTLAAGITVHL